MSDTQSILLNKKTYIKLKRMADENECSVNEEIGNAITNYFDDIDEDTLEEIDVIPRKDKVFVVLPEEIYSLLEEEAESNATNIDDELVSIFNSYLEEDEEGEGGEDDDEDSEEESEDEDEESEDEDEEYEDEEEEEYEDEDSDYDESEDEEEYEEDEEDEEPVAKKKTKKEKGFFESITDAVSDFVEDLTSDEDDKKKTKK